MSGKFTKRGSEAGAQTPPLLRASSPLKPINQPRTNIETGTANGGTSGQPRTWAPTDRSRWSLFPAVFARRRHPSMGTRGRRPRLGNRRSEAQAGIFRGSRCKCSRRSIPRRRRSNEHDAVYQWFAKLQLFQGKDQQGKSEKTLRAYNYPLGSFMTSLCRTICVT
jgi:hypothetical protein